MREMTNTYTPQEQKNIELVKEYMQIAYDPKDRGLNKIWKLDKGDRLAIT
jgi:hypothetical protein